jgi:hypothetical protein
LSQFLTQVKHASKHPNDDRDWREEHDKRKRRG